MAKHFNQEISHLYLNCLLLSSAPFGPILSPKPNVWVSALLQGPLPAFLLYITCHHLPHLPGCVGLLDFQPLSAGSSNSYRLSPRSSLLWLHSNQAGQVRTGASHRRLSGAPHRECMPGWEAGQSGPPPFHLPRAAAPVFRRDT